MTMQTDVAGDAKAVKADGLAAKPAKTAKAAPEKATKEKQPKTAYSGRVTEIALGDDGALTLVLKDKRGKSHDFSLSPALTGQKVSHDLLLLALSGKLKLHATTRPDGTSQIVRLSVHAKK